MRYLVIATTVLVYLTGAALTFGAMNATDQRFCHEIVPNVCDEFMIRKFRAFAYLAAVIPPFWINGILITSFWTDGISFTATPSITH